MNRGEIWTVAGGAAYAGKPRPAVTVCPLTSQTTDLPLFRIPVDPSPTNGLAVTSCLMVDKLTTVPRARVGRRIGLLDDALLVRMNRSILVFLGLAR